ncbi:cytochrome c biogenesis CcdA family protein [Alicyclobacillus sp. SP_1]|uniref:cytochrome c biogenesis CcdA family protein n=1 Tax=Alicyclobacillus sp. SP_1 TaxID=2942475 RepID=UPI002158747D|nr:cytochrome c biogenesis protein CcdA [Alicyclobacillus sp. SP_1]
MLPAFIGYLSGTAAEVSAGSTVKWRMTKHSVAFVAGFSTTVIGLGMIAAVLGKAFSGWIGYAGVVGGILLLLLGLQRFGALRLPWLQDAGFGRPKVSPVAEKPSYSRSYLTGFTLAFGWQVTLLLVLTLVVGLQESLFQKFLLLLIYSAGFSAMFLFTFVFSRPLVSAFRRLGRHTVWVDRAAGTLMIGIAVVLITTDGNLLKSLADWKTGPIIKSLFHGRL